MCSARVSPKIETLDDATAKILALETGLTVVRQDLRTWTYSVVGAVYDGPAYLVGASDACTREDILEGGYFRLEARLTAVMPCAVYRPDFPTPTWFLHNPDGMSNRIGQILCHRLRAVVPEGRVSSATYNQMYGAMHAKDLADFAAYKLTGGGHT